MPRQQQKRSREIRTRRNNLRNVTVITAVAGTVFGLVATLVHWSEAVKIESIFIQFPQEIIKGTFLGCVIGAGLGFSIGILLEKDKAKVKNYL